MDYNLDSLRKHRTIGKLLRADLGALPFSSKSFDLVTANMVVEHVSDPVLQFSEIARVLRPGGSFLLHTPNLSGYPTRISRLLPDAIKKTLARALDGRGEDDVFPTYYRANTESMIRDVATLARLEVAEVHFTCTSPIFGRVPPLAALELLYIRQLMRRPRLIKFRQTIICALRNPTY